jgi:hypothetical protein
MKEAASVGGLFFDLLFSFGVYALRLIKAAPIIHFLRCKDCPVDCGHMQSIERHSRRANTFGNLGLAKGV